MTDLARELGRLRLALTAPDMPPVEGSDVGASGTIAQFFTLCREAGPARCTFADAGGLGAVDAYAFTPMGNSLDQALGRFAESDHTRQLSALKCRLTSPRSAAEPKPNRGARRSVSAASA